MLLFFGMNCFGQVKLYRSFDEGSQDSTITSGEDTLDGTKISKELYVFGCKVKVYLTKNGDSKYYRLYFIFENIRTFSLSKENLAIITFTDNSTLEMPYDGKYTIYGEHEEAHFPIDPNKYISQLSTKEIKYVKLQTSEVDYNVLVTDQFKSKIKDIFLALAN